ncbi:hypothetical protein TEHD86_1001 [Tetragenococcus halophilus subsp. halophilus]|uniref:glycosyltransferase family 1 protein n=1 Tax=Tetragenococcus halophilus TaxID=51669 RepID=UPI000CBC1F67|nr:glycosyltransferase family 1 protein [Tetragenococcus halophilus]MCT8311114.1 glycosyltransferase family 1 protein [Tetragenococcus halophilus]GBD82279.1 hypothetical protein TEHD86_1001 [Tetragenococcus halophilus subsp. halophilus]
MEKLKVLYLVNSLGKGSGVMSFVMNTYRNIDRKNIQIDFIVNKKTDVNYEKELKELGANIYYILAPQKISVGGIKKYFKKVWNFFELHKNEYEVIHSHVPTFNFWYFPIAKKFGIEKRIVHSHSSNSSSRLISRIRNFFLLTTVKQTANYFIACSKEAAVYLFGKKLVYKNKVTIINNGIDIERFSYNEGTRHSLRKELGLEGKFVLGHVGRFSDEKNHKFLIETFFRITQIYPRSILLLIGEGSLKPNIENKITELKLTENVIFLGLRDDVNQVMQAMDSFVLPSLFEGLGIVAIEAQAAGLPCYVSKGVPKEVDITDLITYISLNKSPEHWAQEIVKKKDSSSRSLYSKTIKSKNYDIVDTVKKLENFYYDIN